jgi:nucleoside-diphosphate-sugar epimerase
MTRKIAFVAGASGLVGMQLLHQLFQNPSYAYVISLGRRELAIKHNKLIQLKVDFDKLNLVHLTEKIREQNMGGDYHLLIEGLDEKKVEIHAFCSLGTTIKQAGSKEKFRQIDHDFVVDFADWCRQQGASKFLYVSAIGADPRSSIFYNKVKGKVEEDLKLLPYQFLGIFQPSILLGNRRKTRLGEEMGKIGMRAVTFLGIMRKYKPIYDHQVAKAMVHAALNASDKKVQTISNREMLAF